MNQPGLNGHKNHLGDLALSYEKQYQNEFYMVIYFLKTEHLCRYEILLRCPSQIYFYDDQKQTENKFLFNTMAIFLHIK